jgi:hypothetical protein
LEYYSGLQKGILTKCSGGSQGAMAF